AIYARGHVHVPIEETCDPQLLANHARFEFATKQRPFCAATQYGVPRDPNVELRIISPLPGDVVQDQVFSLLVALDNKGGLIGCLGDDAPCLMTGPTDAPLESKVTTALCQDVAPGVTFQVANVAANWKVRHGGKETLCVDLVTRSGARIAHAECEVGHAQ